jgi:tetratricopeptide (TPR) repeat protein
VPIDREKVLQAAQKHVEKRRFDRAIAEYQKIVQEDPNDARILLKIGDLQARMEQYAEAIATYERVGRYYAAQGFAVKAIAVYKQIRELIRKHVPKLEEQYGHIIFKLAELYQQLGLTGDALTAYDEYATHLQRAGREGEALEVFQRIVEVNGSNPLARLRLAEALVREKKVDEAYGEFSKAADILLEMGRRDDALKVIERMLHHKADATQARRAAELYLERALPNDGMLALAKLQMCFQADQRNLDTLDVLARAFVLIGQAPKANEVRKEMAKIAKEQGKLDLARRIIEQLQAAAPDDTGVQALSRALLGATGESVRAPSAVSAVPVEDAEIEVSEEAFPESLERPEQALDDTGAFAPWEEPGFEGEEGPTLGPASSARGSHAVEVDDQLEAVEDLGAPAPVSRAPAHARDVLANAEAFRRLRLHAKALETLRIGLELHPHSIELHEAYKQVLLESGDQRGAIDEMVTIAAMQLDALDLASAAAALQEVLELQPGHGRARELLVEMGFEPPPLAADTAEVPQVSEQAQPPPREPLATLEAVPGYERDYEDSLDAFDQSEPLPSYDLEEIAPAKALAPSVAGGPASRRDLLSADDPFHGAEEPGTDATEMAIDEPFGPREEPLPSFPLLDEERRSRLELVPEAVESEEPEVAEDTFSGSAAEALAQLEAEQGSPERLAAPLAGARGFQGGDSLEDALEEADFFASRNLFEDALSILSEQLLKFPAHPLLVEREREIREAMASSAGSGELEVPQHEPSSRPATLEDRSYDIAASLAELDEPEPGPASGRPSHAGASIDVEEVFAKFKEGVRRQVSESETETHYDLGVAYREMGLLRDALGEFELAARDPNRECVCWSMIGMIRMELGDADGAIEAFIRGLHGEHRTPDEELALYYELGRIYEVRRNAREALYYFQMIERREPGYRDVAARIRVLQPGPVPGLRAAVGEDDFDRAFDDMLGGSKLS